MCDVCVLKEAVILFAEKKCCEIVLIQIERQNEIDIQLPQIIV